MSGTELADLVLRFAGLMDQCLFQLGYTARRRRRDSNPYVRVRSAVFGSRQEGP